MSSQHPPLPKLCFACTNEFELLPNHEKATRNCPFCQTVIWPKMSRETLVNIGSFRDLQPFSIESPSVVFEALRDGEKRLVTFLDCGSSEYTSVKSYRDLGRTAPWESPILEPHPNLLRTYPVEWVGDVAIVSMDFFDGKALGNWLEEIVQIDNEDAVSIVLTCIRVLIHVGEKAGRIGQIHPGSIQILKTGEVKLSAFAGFLFNQFEISICDRYLDSNRTSKVPRYSWGGYTHANGAGIGEEKGVSVAESAAYRVSQEIFCVGCLLIELLTDQVFSIGLSLHFDGDAKYKIRKFVEEMDAPRELKDIIQRMMEIDPTRGYSNFEILLTDLEDLGLERPTVELIHRGGPPIDFDAIRQARNEIWIQREDGYDFRRIRWGMSGDEIKKGELLKPSLDMPAMMSFDTKFGDMSLSVNYIFAEEYGERICVAANIIGSDLIGFMKHDSLRQLSTLQTGPGDIRQIQEKQKQLRREGRDEEAIQLMINFQKSTEKSQKELEQHLAQLRPDIMHDQRSIFGEMKKGSLDTEKLNRVYQQIVELISIDFGSPDFVEENPEIVDKFTEALSMFDNSEQSASNEYCKATYWSDDTTQVSLSIQPLPLGDKMISVSFVGVGFQHLMGDYR